MFLLVALSFTAIRLQALTILPENANTDFEAYLFVHFTGESPLGEQIYFSVSTNGLDWADLNNSMPVLMSDLGEKGVRDPAIIRSADGSRFYILATDLRIANGAGWDAARFEGSDSLIIWESTDLTNWSKPWSAKITGAISDPGCTWAPEAIYDEEMGEYVVYWATIAVKDGVKEARIYTSKTKDFHNFSPAELYIERVGEGVNSKDIIDTQILKVDSGEYKYYRVSRDSQITIEAANSIFGKWDRIGDISHLGYTAREVEGPILFKLNNEDKWCLMVDQYARSGGYLPLISSDLSDAKNFRVLKPEEYSLGVSHKRHGGVLNITKSEYDALLKKWPSDPICKIELFGNPGLYLRHANFKARFDKSVKPDGDSQWRIVAGLSKDADTVSFQSQNFPEYYLVPRGEGFAIVKNDGTSDFTSRASFKKVPGLADPKGVSFQVNGTSGKYLLHSDSVLTSGKVAEQSEKSNATFRLVMSGGTIAD